MEALIRLLMVVAVAVGSSVIPAARVTGNATWYDAPSIHDAAAGPGLRKALGSGWRGSVVRVSSGGHSVVVTLSDWCACRSGNRVIDLDDKAFQRLAPLSAGIIVVSITVVGGIDEPVTATAPPTDVEGGN